jgi:hypothetical protein
MKELYIEAGHRWLTLLILATWKTEFGRIVVGGQLVQIVLDSTSPK